MLINKLTPKTLDELTNEEKEVIFKNFRLNPDTGAVEQILPQGWQEIDLDTFWRELTGNKLLQYEGFQQFVYNTNLYRLPTILSVKLYIFKNGDGLAMTRTNLYKFGCHHNYLELSPQEASQEGYFHSGMFCHISKCSYCGDVRVVDSSD